MFETLDSGIFTALVLTGGLGWFLMQLGLRGRLLERRRSRQRCTACLRIWEDDRPCRCRH